ncbi:MAG: glycosyltransferase family 2 protein [Oscillospiraceae bacterium]
MADKIYLVVPCYNEEAVLQETTKRLTEKFSHLIAEGLVSKGSRVIYVDDGSKDKTWQLIEMAHSENKLFSGIKLSRNRGHQNALLAGLLTVKDEADAVISMDADLQDDIGAIDEMVKKYTAGADIVYGVRSKRATDTAFKRATAEGFYKVMNGLGAKVVYNHADYRLMSRRALDALEQYGEVNLFLRGIVTLIGYKTDIVYYERNERFAGESKYPLKKMLSFAWDGITSFSVKPLQIITGMGMIVCALSIIGLIYCLISWIVGSTVQGWTSMTMIVLLLGGVQLLSLGIIGEYIGKIYGEVKHRPRFIIETYLN